MFRTKKASSGWAHGPFLTWFSNPMLGLNSCWEDKCWFSSFWSVFVCLVVLFWFWFLICFKKQNDKTWLEKYYVLYFGISLVATMGVFFTADCIHRLFSVIHGPGNKSHCLKCVDSVTISPKLLKMLYFSSSDATVFWCGFTPWHKKKRRMWTLLFESCKNSLGVEWILVFKKSSCGASACMQQRKLYVSLCGVFFGSLGSLSSRESSLTLRSVPILL